MGVKTNDLRRNLVEYNQRIMPHLSRRDIEMILWKDLDEKHLAFDQDRTGSIPRAEYEVALRRFNDFIVLGKIPPDLDTGQATAAARS